MEVDEFGSSINRSDSTKRALNELVSESKVLKKQKSKKPLL